MGGEFPFTLVVDGHALAVQSDHLLHALHQGPSAPFSVRFPVFLGPEFRLLVLVWCFFFGLVAALVSGFGWFSSGFFFFGSASVGFGGVSLLLVVLLSLASFLHRESAPPASRPQWRPTPHPL